MIDVQLCKNIMIIFIHNLHYITYLHTYITHYIVAILYDSNPNLYQISSHFLTMSGISETQMAAIY